MSLGTTAEKQQYNEAAIRLGNALVEHRRSRRDRSPRPERSLSDMLPASDKTALGVALEYARMGNRPVSESLERRAADLAATFEHLGVTIGTVIHDVDLREPSDDLIALVRSTLLERKVVFFRDQHLSEDEQVAFARCFGDLDAFPFGPQGANPFILNLSHGSDSPGMENGWHTDVTWMERPSLGSIAQMVVCPPAGGDTLFADSHAAWLGLPSQIQERIEHLDGINDYRVFLRGGYGGGGVSDDIINAFKAEIPFGVVHPIVRMHPETNKRALYVHGGFIRQDSLFDRRSGEPVGAEKSRELMRIVLAQHPRPEYQCRFAWQEGSIAFWDNRAVQHYATSDYHPHRRLLRRVTVSGDRPAPASV